MPCPIPVEMFLDCPFKWRLFGCGQNLLSPSVVVLNGWGIEDDQRSGVGVFGKSESVLPKAIKKNHNFQYD